MGISGKSLILKPQGTEFEFHPYRRRL